MRIINKIVLFLCFIIFIMPASSWSIEDPPLEANPYSLEITPNQIIVNLFYNGTTIKATGKIPSESHFVALKLAGKNIEETFKHSRKIGRLWMYLGSITFVNVPEFYFLFTSKDTADLKNSTELLDQLQLGYNSFRNVVEVKESHGEEIDQKAMLSELIKLKEKQGLYKVSVHDFKPEEKGTSAKVKEFSFDFKIPALVPSGQYEVILYSFLEGGTSAAISQYFQSSAKLTIQRGQVVSAISKLAFEHDAVYGIVAIIMAVTAGLLVGFVFRRRGH